MSDLVVIAFDNVDEAGRVRETMRSVEHEGRMSLDDSAVVVRDEEGNFHVKDQVDRGVKIGAVGGGALGLLIAGLLFPVAGLLIGVVGGAIVGKLADTGVDKKFIKDVQEKMEPGTSAIFLLIRDTDPNVALMALKPYKGTVLQSTLPPEAEEEVERLLKKRM